MLNKALSALGALCLAVALVGAGLAACAAPPTTEVLARMFSGVNNQDTPFSHEELVSAAVATRDYTVAGHSDEALYQALCEVNASAAERAGSNGARMVGAPDLTDVMDASATVDVPAAALAFAAADETYVLTPDAISHLDDVYAVVQTATALLVFLAAVALVCCIAVGKRSGARSLGGVLMAAGVLVLALFVALGAWAALDFNGFFAAFHSLFFANGTWTFSYDSLLITMYPTAFWMGMGAVWLVTTCLLSILCVVVGKRLR